MTKTEPLRHFCKKKEDAKEEEIKVNKKKKNIFKEDRNHDLSQTNSNACITTPIIRCHYALLSDTLGTQQRAQGHIPRAGKELFVECQQNVCRVKKKHSTTIFLTKIQKNIYLVPSAVCCARRRINRRHCDPLRSGVTAAIAPLARATTATIAPGQSLLRGACP